jgi:hypothetical protein
VSQGAAEARPRGDPFAVQQAPEVDPGLLARPAQGLQVPRQPLPDVPGAVPEGRHEVGDVLQAQLAVPDALEGLHDPGQNGPVAQRRPPVSSPGGLQSLRHGSFLRYVQQRHGADLL